MPFIAIAVALLASVPAHARSKRRPPMFAGLQSATTCIPGPQRPGMTTKYHLRWEAASRERTPANRIAYEIYQATKPGGEDFAQPTYTTAPGATSFDTPAVESEPIYFVVRARVRGAEDSNTVERQGENLCV